MNHDKINHRARFKKNFYSIFLCLLIIISTVGLVVESNYKREQQIKQNIANQINQHLNDDITHSVNAGLLITVIDANGNIISSETRDLPHDLILNNMYYMMESMLGATVPNIQYISGSTGSKYYSDISSLSPQIIIGTGSATPSVTDYSLNNSISILPTMSVITGTPYGLIFSGIQTFASGQAVSESGVNITFSSISASTALMLRDTFATVNVPANGSITLQYNITFYNVAFTTNYIIAFDSIFYGQSDYYGRCFYRYMTDYNNVGGYTSRTSNFGGDKYIAFGTVNTVTSLSQYNLLNIISNLQLISITTNQPTNTVFILATPTSTSGSLQNIVEAAFFYSAPHGNTGGYNTGIFMFWRTTFTAVGVGITSPATVQFTETF